MGIFDDDRKAMEREQTRDYEPKCVWCGLGPYDRPGFFVMEGHEVAYHEECPAIFAARQAYLDEIAFERRIIDQFIEWYDGVNHYGDFDRSSIPYDLIIAKARNNE